jgi:hypothetical protein
MRLLGGGGDLILVFVDSKERLILERNLEMESETEKGQSVKMGKFRFPRRYSLGAKHSECSDMLKISYTKQLTSDICLDIIHCLAGSALSHDEASISVTLARTCI